MKPQISKKDELGGSNNGTGETLSKNQSIDRIFDDKNTLM